MSAPDQINVLIVDDLPSNLLAMSSVLDSIPGTRILKARSGEEALELLTSIGVAVVVLDVYLPNMSGFDVARRIRRDAHSSKTPIIFVTGSDASEFPVREAYALGAVDYLVKPVVPEVLHAKVSFFVELRRQSLELAQAKVAQFTSALRDKDERLRLILEATRDYAFVVVGLSGKILEWEGGASDITGWAAEEAVGQLIDIIFLDEDALSNRPGVEIEKATRDGRALDVRWHKRKDGTKFFADGVTVPLRDEAGRILAFSKIFRDTTAERSAAEALRSSEEQLREGRDWFSAILNSSGEGIAGTAMDGTCTFVNAEGAGMLGYTTEELIGTNVLALFDAGIGGQPAGVREALAGSRPLRVDKIEMRCRDGSLLPVACSIRPIEIRGRPAGVVIAFSDITIRIESEENLRKLAADLSNVNRRQSRFLATLAHELRNPLAPIVNALELLRRKPDDRAVAERMRSMMSRQVKHLARLVDDLLDIARVNNDKLELSLDVVDLRDIVRMTAEAMQDQVSKRAHAMSVHLPPTPALVRADAVRISQALTNLLSNASKYTPEGGAITVTMSSTAHQHVVSVADTGVGIAADDLPLVFSMFAQVRASHDMAQGGLGIGLSLSQRLVEMHGGTLHAASEGPGYGSRFDLRLPRTDAPVADPIPEDRDVPVSTLDRRLRVLVVDDNKDVAESIAMLLDMCGARGSGRARWMCGAREVPHVSSGDRPAGHWNARHEWT